MADDLERFSRALRWWAGRRDEWPTSSLTGGGAIAELEALLGRMFGGSALALPSGSSAIRTGLQVLGIEPGKTVALVGSSWFGSHGLVEAIGGRVAMADEPVDVVLVDVRALTDPLASSRPLLIDAANLQADEFHRLAACRWDAVTLSFGPGKPIDAGEGGALILREQALYTRATQLTQHPLRQQLLGLNGTDVQGVCERIHPVAAVAALHELSTRGTSTPQDVHQTAPERQRTTGTSPRCPIDSDHIVPGYDPTCNKCFTCTTCRGDGTLHTTRSERGRIIEERVTCFTCKGVGGKPGVGSHNHR